MLKPILSTYNSHERDPNLVFDEPTHTYTILTDPGSKYTSVTTINHSHFPHFDADAVIKNMMKGRNWNEKNKYWGQTPEQIKAQWKQNAESVSGAGTQLHFNIECFMNQDLLKGYTHKDLLENYEAQLAAGTPPPNTSEEWDFFLQYIRASPHLKPYRTEWMIFDEELKLAGSIDMVYENPDGTLTIYDWKRSKDITKVNGWKKCAINPLIGHMPDSNFWHYTLQLNTYKSILERKYDKQVTKLCLVRLHPDNEDNTFELIDVPILTTEISQLFEEREKEVSE